MPDADHTVVTQALASVVRDHGWRVTTDPPRLRASLSDVLGSAADEYRGLVDALVVSAEEGTPRTVRDAGVDGVPARRDELVGSLESWGLSHDRASWVVAAWADLLPARTDTPPTHTSAPPVVADVPTVLPTARPNARPNARGVVAPTEIPVSSGAAPLETTGGGPHPSRLVWLVAGCVLALLVSGGAFALTRPHGKDAATQHPKPQPSTSPSATGTPLKPGRVVVASSARPRRAHGRFVMANQDGGVQLRAFGPVDSVKAGQKTLVPPSGGSLVAFTLGGWCPTSRCHAWESLGLRVAAGGTPSPVPHGGPTFVVAVGRGRHDVALVLHGGGHQQQLSLTDGHPGRDNVTVLTQKTGTRRVNASADFLATTSPLQFLTPSGTYQHTMSRRAVVTTVDLAYYAGRLTPKDPGHALLFVHAYYDYSSYGDDQHYPFQRDEVHFQPQGGRERPPLTEPTPDHDGAVVYAFEVPGDMTNGSFVIGARGLPRTTPSATAGVPAGTPYTLSLSTARIPVRLS